MQTEHELNSWYVASRSFFEDRERRKGVLDQALQDIAKEPDLYSGFNVFRMIGERRQHVAAMLEKHQTIKHTEQAAREADEAFGKKTMWVLGTLFPNYSRTGRALTVHAQKESVYLESVMRKQLSAAMRANWEAMMRDGRDRDISNMRLYDMGERMFGIQEFLDDASKKLHLRLVGLSGATHELNEVWARNAQSNPATMRPLPQTKFATHLNNVLANLRVEQSAAKNSTGRPRRKAVPSHAILEQIKEWDSGFSDLLAIADETIEKERRDMAAFLAKAVTGMKPHHIATQLRAAIQVLPGEVLFADMADEDAARKRMMQGLVRQPNSPKFA